MVKKSCKYNMSKQKFKKSNFLKYISLKIDS